MRCNCCNTEKNRVNKIRIGNQITLLLNLNVNGEVMNEEYYTKLRFFILNPYFNRKEITNTRFTDGVIEIQTLEEVTGMYSIEVRYYEEDKLINTIDLPNVFMVVASTDNEELSENTISIQTQFNINGSLRLSLKGDKGERGEDGKSLRFEDLTEEQKRELRPNTTISNVGLTQHIIDSVYKYVNVSNPESELAKLITRIHKIPITEEEIMPYNLKENYHIWDYYVSDKDVLSMVRAEVDNLYDDVAINYRDIRPLCLRIEHLNKYAGTMGDDLITEIYQWVRLFNEEKLPPINNLSTTHKHEITTAFLVRNVINVLFQKLFGTESDFQRDFEYLALEIPYYMGYSNVERQEYNVSSETAKEKLTEWLNLRISNRVLGLLSSKYEQKLLEEKYDSLETKFNKLKGESDNYYDNIFDRLTKVEEKLGITQPEEE